jgi:hypothetical protein
MDMIEAVVKSIILIIVLMLGAYVLTEFAQVFGYI